MFLWIHRSTIRICRANRINDSDLDSPKERIQKAYRILYQRDPNEEEVLAGIESGCF